MGIAALAAALVAAQRDAEPGLVPWLVASVAALLIGSWRWRLRRGGPGPRSSPIPGAGSC